MGAVERPPQTFKIGSGGDFMKKVIFSYVGKASGLKAALKAAIEAQEATKKTA